MAMSKWLAAAAVLAALNLSGCTGPDKRTTTNPTPNSMQRPGAPTAMGTNNMPTNNAFGTSGAPMNTPNNFRPISNGPAGMPNNFSGAPMSGPSPAAFPMNNDVRMTTPGFSGGNPPFTPPGSGMGPTGFAPTGMPGSAAPAPMPPYGAPTTGGFNTGAANPYIR